MHPEFATKLAQMLILALGFLPAAARLLLSLWRREQEAASGAYTVEDAYWEQYDFHRKHLIERAASGVLED